MKIKPLKTAFIMSAITMISIIIANMLKDNLSFLRVEFLQHGKGYAQHFINSFIN